jgi:Zn-dependent protease with chaperone function
MVESTGTYFDGRSSRATPVLLLPLPGGDLRLSGPQLERRESIRTLRLERPPGCSRLRLHWSDGGLVELDDDRLAELFAHRASQRLDRLRRWAESHTIGVLVGLVLAAASVTAAGVLVLPRLASWASGAVPRSVERQLGERLLAQLETTAVDPSRLPPASQSRVHTLLERLQPPGASGRRLSLQLRESELFGANAFCLPGGILLVTDALVRLASDDELLAVLAHEAGHDRLRHPLQMAVRLQALSFVTKLFGQGSDPLRTVGQQLVGNAYSRGFEREADREAVAMLRRLNRPPEAFVSILDKLERKRGPNRIPSFLLTHPSTRERRELVLGSPPSPRP